MPTSTGDLVHPDWGVPAWVLGHPDCPTAVRSAYDALETANAATSAERDEVDAIRDAFEDNRAAITAAIRAGKNPPAPVSQEITDEHIRQGEIKIRTAMSRAYAAARAYENSVPANHEGLRPILAARLPELAATSARAIREARAAYEEAEGVSSAIAGLDNLRAARRPTTVEQHAALALHYKAVHQANPRNFPGRLARLGMAWEDLTVCATGIPADLIAADPFEEV
ncbi:hypothetical protein GA0070622_5301 [Micromonospora sediminicola]|uniref:Uncharacterized protein n=1 Tax=Micromonospora sediminicola TaxID=946078 RepID=A0A1A9BFB5_9ACTN|nr:hypothetical protein [Micromonospora sediminicola]SBT68205.1 hypothetical protein GA0070622_5301 [Micromonospora sediminicola]